MGGWNEVSRAAEKNIGINSQVGRAIPATPVGDATKQVRIYS